MTIDQWLQLAKERAGSMLVGGTVAIAILAPCLLFLYNEQKALYAEKIKHIDSVSKFEVEKESNARYIADLQATNASLSDEIKRDRKLLETAVSDVIREQNAAAARDHDLRIELDGYVDQARRVQLRSATRLKESLKTSSGVR